MSGSSLAKRQPPYPTAWTCRSLVEHPPSRLNVRRAADYQKVRPAPSQNDPDQPATLAPSAAPRRSTSQPGAAAR